MSKVNEPGFIFINSGVLDKKQVETTLEYCITKLRKLNPAITDSRYYVNVVESKDGKKFGHTYAWVGSLEVYYALIGKNFDGTPRIKQEEDPNWVPPEEDYEELMQQAEDDNDWARIDEVESMFIHPTINVEMEPIIVPPAVKYTEKQKREADDDSDFGYIYIFPSRVTIRTEENKSNTLYSNSAPDWVTEAMFRNFFAMFNRDTTVYIDKNKNKITYPKVVVSEAKGKKWDTAGKKITVTFSPLQKYLAHFVFNVCRKIQIKNPSTNKDQMFFFSHMQKR